MADLSKEELEKYFQCDKENWNEDLTLEFWEKLRAEKIEKNDYVFTGFEFPKFNEEKFSEKYDNFWTTNDNNIIDQDVEFHSCFFNDLLSFKYLKFEKEFTITDTAFKERVVFFGCQFQSFRIDHSYFLKGFETIGYRERLSFNKEVEISNSYFYHYLSFSESIVNDKFNITNNFINGGFSLHDVDFNSNNICVIKDIFRINIGNIEPLIHLKLEFLAEELRYSKSEYFSYEDLVNKKEMPFKTAETFLLEQNIYKDIHEISDLDLVFEFKKLILRTFERLTPKIELSGVKLSKNFNFSNIDFSNAKITDSYFDNVIFNNCKWNISNSRIILIDEKNNTIDYQITYRELKRNFENLKDWEFSGFAYVSEMEMRKFTLWNDQKYAHWFFYQFYYTFAGYTQNFLRPLYWFLVLAIIVFPAIYFFYDEKSIVDALQISISNAFPIVKTELTTQLWWVETVQVMLGGTLLAFFILALRKRFKQ